MVAQEVSDDEWLLRRIPPWHLPQEDQTLSAAAGQVAWRPPSAAFSLDPGEIGISFHLESSLRAAGEPLTYGCPYGVPGWAVTRISAGAIRRLGLQIVLDGKPHHVLVLGLADIKGKPQRRLQREIAKLSHYVVPPRAT